jgi:NifU-like protein
MSRISETLMEHFQWPANRSAMKAPNLVGKGSLNGYPPFVTLYLRIYCNRITEAIFQADGCGVTIACSSMLTELLRGRSLAESRQITVHDLAQALDGIPIGKEYCPEVAIAALRDAIPDAQYRSSGSVN